MAKARVSHANYYRLCKWLESQPQEKLEGQTMDALARVASEDLGITIATSTFKEAKESTGRDWKGLGNSRSNNCVSREEFHALHMRVRAIEDVFEMNKDSR